MTATPEAKAPKIPNPKAYDDSMLDEVSKQLPSGVVLDVVEIGKIDFAILSADNLQGVNTLTKGNEAKAAQLFNRALRIDAPARLDARERLATARKNGTLTEVVAKIQDELFSFDVTSIATRAPRTPPTVTAPDQATYSKAEVDAMLAAANIKFVTK